MVRFSDKTLLWNGYVQYIGTIIIETIIENEVGLGDIGIGDMRLLHSHSMRLLQYCM